MNVEETRKWKAGRANNGVLYCEAEFKRHDSEQILAEASSRLACLYNLTDSASSAEIGWSVK
jgi:hypothetical protein